MKQALKYEIKPVARACDVLAAFGSPTETLGLPEIARRAGLHKVTTFRMLKTLEYKGLVERAGVSAYRSRIRLVGTTKRRIGFASQGDDDPFFDMVTKSLLSAAHAVNTELVVLNNASSRQAALRNASHLVRERVDLAMEFQLIWDISEELSGCFAAAGIPLIAIDNPLPGAVYFGADNYRAGTIGGRYLGQWVRHEWQGTIDQIVLLGVDVAGPVQGGRMCGILDGLTEVLPNARAAALFRYDVKGRFAIALETTRKHLRRYPHGRIVVGAINDVSALAALAAFREAGLEQNCAILGQGGIPEARNELRRRGSRLIGTVAYFPETYGERLMPIAEDVLSGNHLPPAVFTDHRLLTASNIDRIYTNDFWMTPGSTAIGRL